MKRSATLSVLSIFFVSPLFASEISVDPGDCSTGVRVVARDAPFGDVMRKLASALNFELRFEGNAASIVNVDLTMPAPELVTKLSPGDSVIVTQARDPRCRARYRIAKVWVLPNGPRATAAPTTPNSPSTSTVVPKEQQARYDEMSRRAKEKYEEYVRMHGHPPPGEPEEIGAPK